MIEIDGTALPLDPGKTYLILIRDGEIPRSQEIDLAHRLNNLGVRGTILRVARDVNQVRVVQVDIPEKPVLHIDKTAIPSEVTA